LCNSFQGLHPLGYMYIYIYYIQGQLPIGSSAVYYWHWSGSGFIIVGHRYSYIHQVIMYIDDLNLNIYLGLSQHRGGPNSLPFIKNWNECI
jgi:hypothetical protein